MKLKRKDKSFSENHQNHKKKDCRKITPTILFRLEPRFFQDFQDKKILKILLKSRF